MTQIRTREKAATDPWLDDATELGEPRAGWRRQLFVVIFKSDTRIGKLFDVLLIIAIVASVAAVLADSVESIARRHGSFLNGVEWVFTILFTLEYLARISCVDHRLRYITSFYGIVDLAAVLPTYLALLFPETALLIDVRILRLMRVFRIFKLTAYLAEYRLLGEALAASRRKIMVFLSVVALIVLVIGTLMYVLEGPRHGFTSIPLSVYWAITTMTTVGYGDLVPATDLGRLLASIIMLLGWGILAVPTGIVTAEMTAQRFRSLRTLKGRCPSCGCAEHEVDAEYCKICGTRLDA
jgi:voltage-gated potassium channel